MWPRIKWNKLIQVINLFKVKDINDTKVLISLNEDFRPHPLERMVKAPSNTIMFIWKRWSITRHLKGLNVLCNRDKGIKTNHCREVLLTHQLNIMQLETFQAPQERADRCTYVGMPARARTSAFIAYSLSLLLTPSFIFTLSCELLSKKKPLWITNSALDRVP